MQALFRKNNSSDHSIDPRKQWSSIFGWVSIASWVIVYSPQLHENYVLKSADGLSIEFVCIWLAGDALNGIGAYRQGLLWTMIILAAYYCLCDIALIGQFIYYRRYFRDGKRIIKDSQHAASLDERTLLLPTAANGDHEEHQHPGSSAISCAAATHEEAMQEEGAAPSTWQGEALRYALALALVIISGVLAWYFTSAGDKKPSSGDDGGKDGRPAKEWKWDAQVFGWASAFLYLSSRLPQIAKNMHTKCEGLSLALFLFAVMGNLTYVASIMITSTDPDYLLENLSWLVGSLGTILLDFIVLAQFVSYAPERKARREDAKRAHASARAERESQALAARRASTASANGVEANGV
ncbi:hypothetical protein K437DRAFT_256017 [Tilletiaria anomala UBC 951]|uniref:PQ-loop-domain-containing protein n=1 Tax=Tilletiaria anomala (strain ATCC 24038 / CBS 436.72 / UBC 951) TaxID=1037660 RepID=A0A066VZT8_TILAU|nr:uncharacterized protein K437DRAFT_256017 [Tilletiaria anomala UBC 951]KDN46996.1 hypothetical protein K437DRAFT_256017 [Tilletiaria anomala UBC 951]